MKRTTILLPDDLAQRVDRERRRRDVSAAAIIREAVAAYFAESPAPKRYSFIGIANSGGGEFTAANIDEFLEREYADWIEESSGLRARREAARTEIEEASIDGVPPSPPDADAGHS